MFSNGILKIYEIGEEILWAMHASVGFTLNHPISVFFYMKASLHIEDNESEVH